MTLVLYVAFMLSGAAGLMYEAIWTRYLGLFVGHGAYAQVIVLVIFLGGMSIGALLVGRRAERVRRPLLWYSAAELAVGLAAIAFHATFVRATGWAYDALFPAIGGPAAVMAAKWALAGLLVLPQSVVLGTTFPLMSAGVIRSGRAPGGTLALLYFSNSFGASIGVLVAGFWLLSVAGLPGTLGVAAAINIGVAIVVGAIGASRRWRRTLDSDGEADGDHAPLPALPVGDGRARATAPSVSPTRPARANGPTGGELVAGRGTSEAIVAVGGGPPMVVAATIPDAPLRAVTRLAATYAPPVGVEPAAESPARLLLLVAFGTAVASFVYEIAWIRMLSLVLGSATHSFELMLSAFILGLAIGALWIRRRIDRLPRPLRTLGIVQWTMGALAVATLPLYLWSFHLTAALLGALGRTSAGYDLFTVARYGLALLVMLPATVCAGMTLPLITRTLMTAGAGERAIGLVYGVNTFGSIVGAALAGLVLLPLVGLEPLLVVGALLDMALGVWLLVRATEGAARPGAPAADRARVIHLDDRGGSLPETPGRRLALGAAAATMALVVAVTAGVDFDTRILTSGVYRYATLGRPGADTVLWYRDGRTATVSVRLNHATGSLTIATNGKPDASVTMDWLRPVAAGGRRELSGDQPTQLLLPLVTLAHAPRARQAAVIGQGSGMSSHFLLGSPMLRELTTIDIEPEMIRGSRWFQPANRRVFEDPRSRFAVDDARSWLAARGARYDLVLSEPSNPWVSGVSGLFTVEFYGRVRRYLAPGGVFGQWLHLYEIDDTLVTSVIAAVHRSFPSYEVFLVSNADILIVASNAPRLPAPDWSVFALPGVREDLRWVAPLAPGDLEALRLAGRDVLAPLLERRGPWATPNSDFRPALDLGAERTRFLHSTASGFTGIGAARFDVVAALTGRRRGFGAAPDPTIPGIPRLEALALGARLRLTDAAADSTADDDVRDARFRVTELRRALATGAPPSDWRRWTEAFVVAEDRLHGGTAGVADERFYGEVARYLDRTGAPPAPRNAVRFLHALARWDWREAHEAAPALVDAAARGEEWLPEELVRNGAVVAALETGDTAGARRAYGRMAPLVPASATLRSALLEAWIARAERTSTARPTPAPGRSPSSDSHR